MATFTVPIREQVSAPNQQLFDVLTQKLGMVPNLYAMFAHSENALSNYLTFQQGQAKGAFNARLREAIYVAVSQANGCAYCLAAHTVLGKMNGFSDEQLLGIRAGHADFDPKLDAVVRLTHAIAGSKGHPAPELIDNFYAAGYGPGALADLVLLIADKTAMNYLHNITQIPVDFPAALAFQETVAV